MIINHNSESREILEQRTFNAGYTYHHVFSSFKVHQETVEGKLYMRRS